LKIYHAYHDKFNDVWKDYDLQDIPPVSIRDAYALPSHLHEYSPGVLALHSGMELHCIAPFKVPSIESEEEKKGAYIYRITLQGWGQYTNDGVWRIFS